MNQTYGRLVSRAAIAATVMASLLLVIKIFAWWYTGSVSILAALVDSLVAGTPVTASRGPVVQDFKHVSRVLAGFEDDLVDEGGAGGAATMVGLEIARKHHWHAPAYSGSETADASNAEVGDAHVGEANSSADRATSAGAPKDLEKGKDV